MYLGIESGLKQEFSYEAIQEWSRSLKDMTESSIQLVKGPPTRWEIRPGIYSIFDDKTGKSLSKVQLTNRDLIFVKNESTDRLAREFNNFLEKKEQLSAKGFANKRGIILSGLPGTGKSSLVYQLALEMADRGTVVLICNSPYEVKQAESIIKDYIHGRNTMIVLEDIDESIGEYGVHSLLQTMDGLSSKQDTIFISTTNDINTVPKKLLRPGRFDIKISIDNPSDSDRNNYLEHKLKNKKLINYIKNNSKDFSYADLSEVVKAVSVYGESPKEAINRIRSDKEIGYDKSKSYLEARF